MIRYYSDDYELSDAALRGLGLPPMPPLGRGKPLSPDCLAELEAENNRQARREVTAAHRSAVLAEATRTGIVTQEAADIMALQAVNRVYQARHKAKKKAAAPTAQFTVAT